MTQRLTTHRQDEHVFLAEKYLLATAHAGFDTVRSRLRALPESTLADVDLTPPIPFGWRWPIYINAMTGGSPTTGQRLALSGTLALALDLDIECG